MVEDISVEAPKVEPKVAASITIKFIEGEQKPKVDYENIQAMALPTLLKRIAKDIENELLQ